VGLLSGVRPDVTSLVFETMEGLVAKGTLVRAGKILSTLVVALLRGIVQEGSHEAHGGSGHGGVVELGRVLLLFGGSLRIEEVVKTELRGSG
jgi:hypothetical protein